MSTAPTPARAVAYEVLRATFEAGAHTDAAFRDAADRDGLTGRDRAHAQRLAYGSVQRRGSTDAVIRELAARAPRLLDPPVLASLRLGLYELLFEDVAEHAAVDQAVELAKRAGAAHASGLVNAVLRRAIRERAEILGRLSRDETPVEAASAHSVPVWLAEMWWRELGPDDARALLRASNEPAERALRVNTLRASRDEMAARLAAAGADVRPAPGPAPLDSPQLLVLAGRLEGARELIGEGAVVPQSRGSAAVVEVLSPQPGEKVLDLCAGPGIKTGQIAQKMGDRGELIAIEPDADRAEQVADQAQRLGLRSATVIEADGAEFGLGEPFDRILVDAPCSGLGTLASRPDVRWRRSPEAIARLAHLQRRLLLNAARRLRPGGTLVYATCTISKDENQAVVAAVEGKSGVTADDLGGEFPELADPLDRRFLTFRPDRDRTTGFFVARLTRHD
jgi:16S rRNA (cytosine967-C5)-methyltransferase